MKNSKECSSEPTEKNRIAGNWSSKRVWIGPKELLPGASQKAWDHSPDGFNWGYGGSGPSQLALAILLDLTHDTVFSVNYHHAFKWEIVARLPQSNFTLPLSDVKEWIKKARSKNHAEPS